MPPVQVVAQTPPQPSEPPHLPLHVGLQLPPSPEDVPGDCTEEPDSAVYEEHAEKTMAASMTGAKKCFMGG